MANNPPPPEPEPQELLEADAMYGTPVLGANSAAWGDAVAFIANTKPESAEKGANATVKVLWDEANLYVRAEVADTVLSDSDPDTHEQDSVEVFVSEENNRNGYSGAGDGQYRVNFNGAASFKETGMGEGFESFAEITATGYTVEMKIPFKAVTPAEDHVIGFDVQINDMNADATVRNITIWCDLKADGYNTNENWGKVTLATAEEPVVPPTPSEPPAETPAPTRIPIPDYVYVPSDDVEQPEPIIISASTQNADGETGTAVDVPVTS